MIDGVPGVLAKQVLTRWPAVVEKVTKGLQPLVGLLGDEDAETVASGYAEWNATPAAESPPSTVTVRLEDASKFVQQMASVEGQIRLHMIKAGCNCKMDLRAQIVDAQESHSLVQVFSLHDPICGWIQKIRLDHPELEDELVSGNEEETRS